ncbi:conserved hypothetical protein [Methylobacterium nodulans ORS 2060]|uniref:Uncharacterized protein n=1 Tax=Methylobacterium nodulans (strain LMG 21967 / CNCM I-2342 / ORS 2060) TaxID=460265 RepID=B8IEP1_METNO|nr:conserved hypothetical protein [Methylobacterium nodulans ORS 2060]
MLAYPARAMGRLLRRRGPARRTRAGQHGRRPTLPRPAPVERLGRSGCSKSHRRPVANSERLDDAAGRRPRQKAAATSCSREPRSAGARRSGRMRLRGRAGSGRRDGRGTWSAGCQGGARPCGGWSGGASGTGPLPPSSRRQGSRRIAPVSMSSWRMRSVTRAVPVSVEPGTALQSLICRAPLRRTGIHCGGERSSRCRDGCSPPPGGAFQAAQPPDRGGHRAAIRVRQRRMASGRLVRR